MNNLSCSCLTRNTKITSKEEAQRKQVNIEIKQVTL